MDKEDLTPVFYKAFLVTLGVDKAMDFVLGTLQIMCSLTNKIQFKNHLCSHETGPHMYLSLIINANKI